MKFFKRFSVAVVVTAIVVVLCGGYAIAAAPANLPNVQAGDWVCDAAGVLSSDTEETVREYNERFDVEYGAYVAVATVNSMKGWEAGDFVQETAVAWDLGSYDMIFVMDIGDDSVYLMEGGAYPEFDYDAYLTNYVDEDFFAGRYDDAVLSLLGGMDTYFAGEGGGSYGDYEYYDYNYNQYGYGYQNAGVLSLFMILVLVILALAVVRAIDRARYNTWYRQYGYMPNPPVVFRPIFFWHTFRPHGPGFGPGPGPGAGFGPGPGFGPRPGSGPRPGGTTRPGSGFTGRGGGHSGSFGGGFGGHSGGPGGHGGGFGGSRR